MNWRVRERQKTFEQKAVLVESDFKALVSKIVEMLDGLPGPCVALKILESNPLG